MEIGRRHLLSALGVAIGAHLAAAAAWLTWPDAAETGSPGAATVAILLMPDGASPETVQPANTAAGATPDVEPAQPVAALEETAVPVPTSPEPLPAGPEPLQSAAETIKVESRTQVDPTPPPVPQLIATMRPRPEFKERPEKKTPSPPVKRRPKPRTAANDQQRTGSDLGPQTDRTVPESTGAPRHSGNPQVPAVSTDGGAPGATSSFTALLQAWLEKHKRYPRNAQRRRQEGTAVLYFVMDRLGNVLDYRIERTSGHGLLDREVENMIKRAQPLPQIPANLQQARLELVVPVQFSLK